MSDDKMREAFEAWAKQRSLRNSLFGAHEYPHPNCQFAWEVWQAATQASTVDAPTDAERLDWLDARRLQGVTKGYKWDTWGYGTDKPIRAQLDAAMRATPADGGEG